MREYILENKLGTPQYWPYIPTATLKGVENESDFGLQDSEDKRGEAVRSMHNIAVLRATSKTSVKFYVGFFKEDFSQFLKHELTTDLDFGMRVGSKNVTFFVLPVDWESEIKLELVEKTTEDSPKYKELILL